jgi:hypothetical protein
VEEEKEGEEAANLFFKEELTQQPTTATTKEPLSPDDVTVVDSSPPRAPAPTPVVQTPAEIPSTSNNALIMQIRILSEYSQNTPRISAGATARCLGSWVSITSM